MNKPLLPLIILVASLSSIAVEATPLTGHYKPKWTQNPDMDRGTDYLSMHRTNGPIVADDFESDGRDIWGFHWWGSYFLDAGQVADPNVDRMIRFEISFHGDCPVGSFGQPGCIYNYQYSYPQQSYQYVIVDVEESFFGTTAAGEDVYEYWVALSTPWKEIAGNTYWVDFGWDAAQAGQFGLSPGDDIWGWHESKDHWNDFAVQTAPPSPGGNPHLGPWNVLTDVDMAFEVITIPAPATLALFGLGLCGLGWSRRQKG